MFDLDRWQEIWITISRNKMRSILTAFGVFWGIFMLVVMSGSGYGLSNGVLSGVEGFAQNSAFLFTDLTAEAYKGFRKGRYWNMRNDDLDMLKSQVPDLEYIAPILFGYRVTNNVVRGDKYGTYYIKGLNPEYNKIDPQRIVYGRYLNNIDIEDRRKVCMIGLRIYEEMFEAGENPLGQLIRVNGIYYQIIGVNDPIVTNINIGGNFKESVTLPYTVMQQTYNRGDEVDCISITAKSDVSISTIEEHVKELIKARHSISPTDPSALGGFNVEKEFSMFNSLFLGIGILIWIVGLGTLMAGVVGVSNIMMVTVRERTKEIGIRRALGAKPLSIMTQIMNESLILTIFAGFFGLAAGVGLLSLVDSAIGDNVSGDTYFLHPQIPFSMAVIAAVVLLLSGLLAGIVPAWRALQIKAIDAIREE
ncbi:ABC transporter permease [Odoribacter sp. OttesenSCG-928-A06]|nr:ABC transporter permease [Odoribacter sp. OttesenSCG-928-A06]